MSFAPHSCHDVSEDHIDASGHEDWRNQQQQGLEDVCRQLIVWSLVVGDESPDVSHCFKATANKKRNHVQGPRSDTKIEMRDC